MHVISKKRIVDFAALHPAAQNPLETWYKIVSRSEFRSFAHLRTVFPSADVVEGLTVFNVGGNKYRLVAAVHYNRAMVYIRHVMTHEEYDQNKWRRTN